MSNVTNIEPVVAHDEKFGSPMVVLETWWDFFLEMFINPPKNHKLVTAPRVVKNTQNISDSYLLIKFSLFNPHHIPLQSEPGNLLLRGLQDI